MTLSYIVPIGILIFWTIAAIIFPGKKPPKMENIDIIALRKGFKWFEIFSYLGFFILTPIFAFLITYFLYTIYQFYLSSISNNTDAILTIGTTIWLFVIPAIFAGIFLYGFLLEICGKLFQKAIGASNEEYATFRYDWNRRAAGGKIIDSNKLTATMIFLLSPLMLWLLIYCGFGSYTKITNNAVIETSMFKEKIYEYGDITKILKITSFKNQKTEEIEPTRTYYAVVKNNGNRWITLNLSINNTQKEKEIINLISQKSNIPIQEGIHNVDD